MYYEDLSYYSYYLKMPLSNVRNIAWLEKDKPYLKGNISNEFLDKLSDIIFANEIVDAQVNKIRSAHSCSICNNFLEINAKDSKKILGTSEIWIPSCTKGEFFASPSMIYHYIKEHKYLPPQVFIDAVIAFDMKKAFNAQKIYLKEIQKVL